MQHLRATVGTTALALALLASPAMAQTAPADTASAQPAPAPAPAPDPAGTASAALNQPDQTAPGGPTSNVGGPVDNGEIIVTANKRAENVQKVPLAVSVVSPAQLAAAGVRNFADIGKINPSLVIRPAEQPQNSNISLRGVGTFAFGIGVESSVAVLVDEVPLAFQARAFTDLPDVSRIEVLRGPQSTLYGKSASAGLVNIITRDPTNNLQVRANAVVTEDDERAVNFSVSGPLSPTLGYVVSAAYNYWDGNVRNLYNNKEVNGRQTVNVRGKLRFKPSDRVAFTLSGNYIDGKTDVGRPFIRISPNARLRGNAALTPAVVFPGVTIGPDNQDISNNFDSRTKYKGGGGYLRGEIGLGPMNLVTITSYDRFHLYDYLDQDDTSAPSTLGNNNQVGQFKSRQTTQEVRLQSPGELPFRYTIGAYYALTKFERPFVRGPYFSLANWFATARSRQLSAFAQADWTVVPQLTLTAGGRVQNEKVSYTFHDFITNTSFAGSAKDTATTYKASVRYEFTPNINAFATYATGYKGQTYDLTTGFNANRAAAGPIRPEKSRDKELGIRTQFLNRALTLNATLFDTSYKDLQAQTIETLADGTTNFRLTNVGKLRTRGVELESSLRVGEDLNLNGAVTYLDAKYTSFDVAQCYPLQNATTGCVGTPARQNLTGTRAIQAPKWKFNVGGEFTPAVSAEMRGVIQANWQYQSKVYFTPIDPQTIQGSYSIVNLGLGVRDAQRRWELIGFVNNLFDKQYYGSLVNSAGNFGNQIATQAVLPRDFRRYAGMRLGLNF
ncbi:MULTISPECIES: TonB-dependent receptor [Sphingomonas]|uniref:TonB-dependent receptor n=1 Tax=Sphingomonas TaxID=13687 RepID=UPI001F07F1B5|nr:MULTISPECIES: TonB-dependent receptor [Sphingomonas]